MNELERAREHFPTLRKKAYLNSGSYGLLADSVRTAVVDYLDHRLEVGADWPAWVDRAERLRQALASLLHADPGELAITASASAGINSVASALRFTPERNRVLVSNYEFPTSGQIWHAQEQRGAVVSHIAEDARGIIPPEHFERELDERTVIVVLSHVCFRHGGKFSDEAIRTIVDLAHRRGAKVILDTFQTVGVQPLDLPSLGVDFAVGGMFKYLLGTAGIGFLYARGDRSEDLVPTVSGWFAQEQMGSMNIFANEPSRTAARFQAGTPPVPSCYAANAGLELILGYGVEAIAARVRELTTYARDRLLDRGFELATPEPGGARGPMLAIRARHDQLLVERLLARDVVTSSRDGNVRAGFHFYNNREDVDRLIEGLEANRELLP